MTSILKRDNGDGTFEPIAEIQTITMPADAMLYEWYFDVNTELHINIGARIKITYHEVPDRIVTVRRVEKVGNGVTRVFF